MVFPLQPGGSQQLFDSWPLIRFPFEDALDVVLTLYGQRKRCKVGAFYCISNIKKVKDCLPMMLIPADRLCGDLN